MSDEFIYNFTEVPTSDLIFAGTVQKVDSYRVTFDLMGTDPVARAGTYIPPATQTVCDLTVKVDRVFSGTAFKAGDTLVVYTGDVNGEEGGLGISAGSQAVLFADSLVEDTPDGRVDQRPARIERDPDLKEPLGRADVETVSNMRYVILPVRDGYVAAPLEWAFDVRPTVALSADDLYVLSKDLGAASSDPGLQARAAYYSIDDFASALAFYQRKYPLVPYKTFAGKIIPGEFEPTGYSDPDRLPANEQKLGRLREQTGYAEVLRKQEQEHQGKMAAPPSQ